MTKNGKVADMKKIFAVMGLAVKCGETVTHRPMARTRMPPSKN